MLSRSPISLAQLNAGNNSEKRKNEIRQLLHSLHRSKNLQSLRTLKIVRQMSLANLLISLIINLISKTQITKTFNWLIKYLLHMEKH